MQTKTPGPDHTLSFSRPGRRVRALYNGHLIADTGLPVVVHEADMADAVYFPREDVEMSVLRENGSKTCAYKGQGVTYTIFRDGQFAEGGAWSFDHPSNAALQLAGLIAFDPAAVTLEVYEDETDEMWRKQQREMSDYIRHTDSGSGRSQDAPWAPTVHNEDDVDRDLRDPPGGLR